MCFNPTVSIVTAITEWVLSVLIIFKYPFAKMRYLASALMIFLGLYQFSEFMLCKTAQTELWVRVGFVAYTILPAIGLHTMLKLLKIKTRYIWVYVIPATYIILSIITPNFVREAKCYDLFVTARNTLFSFGGVAQTISYGIYTAYYFGFILAASLLGVKKYLKEKNYLKQKIYLTFPLAVFLMSFPTFLIIIIFPALNIQFPSILCHFALLFALAIYMGVRWDNEISSK